MRLKSLGFSSAVVTALCLAAAPVQAQGRGHAQDKDHGKSADHSTAASHRHTGDDDRGATTVRGRSDVPPGLAKKGGVPPGLAKKGGVPPGLAKKGGVPPGLANHRYDADQGAGTLRDILARHGYTVVRTRTDGNSRDVYYRYRNGMLHRAIVAPGTDRLSFSNVPSTVLKDVLARLY
jgi:hypothetical protein